MIEWCAIRYCWCSVTGHELGAEYVESVESDASPRSHVGMDHHSAATHRRQIVEELARLG
jgi:hypothetical protein